MKAIVLAAGQGTRLQPLTDTKPKCMLPIGNKPMVDRICERLKKIGIETAVVIGYKGEMIKDSLGNSVKYYSQKKQLGTGHALDSARNFIDEDKFICVYGDVFTTFDFKELLKLDHPTICVTKADSVERFGKVEFKNKKLTKLMEKSGVGEGFINAGIYLFTPEIFDAIKNVKRSKRGEYELTDAISALNKKIQFCVHDISDYYWNDIGYPWDFIDANLFFLRQVGDIVIGKDSKVHKSAVLKKPVIIGDNCTIKNCSIESSVIGDGCTIGEFSIVKRSVVMNHSNAPHLNYVGDSVIGSNCNLGAGTVTANLRFDKKPIKVMIKGKKVDSGRRKLGVIMGDNTQTGINSSLMPGVKVGPNSAVGPLVSLAEDLPPNKEIFLSKKSYTVWNRSSQLTGEKREVLLKKLQKLGE